MCVHMNPCVYIFKFSDVFIYSRGFAQVSSYVYVCACESGFVCV